VSLNCPGGSPLTPRCRVWVKAIGTEPAVLCTDDKTFAMNMVETSNCVMLSKDNGASELEVQGLLGAHYECTVAPPRLAVLHSMLLATAYTHDEMREELEGTTEEAPTTTPAKRPRKEALSSPLLELVRSPGVASSPSAGTAVDALATAEEDCLRRLPRLTRPQIFASVQASNAEIEDELNKLGVMAIRGKRRMGVGEGASCGGVQGSVCCLIRS
jgi:hypothetical protein